MSERISGVEGTKLDDDFHRCGSNQKSQTFIDKHLLYSMEKKTDLFNELVDDLQIKTKEYLQVRLLLVMMFHPSLFGIYFLILKRCDDA